jgi:hypothetical protein
MKNMFQFISTSAIAAALIASAPAMAKKVEEPRKLPAFSKISANGSSDVTVKVGGKQSVVVKAEEGEVEEIMTEVKGDELVIWREKKKGKRFGMSHSAHVVITVPSLDKLASRGSGDATVTGVDADHFRLIQQGSGDVELDGKCKTAHITGQGSGDLESDKLSCGDVEFDLRGSGDVEFASFNVKDIDLDAMGSGDVTFQGSCDDFKLVHKASGDVEAHRFKCMTVSVKAQGSGDMRVHATDDVKIRIQGSGDVEIYGGGKPSEIKTSGSGRVRTK